MNRAQCRAGRALIDWNQTQLSVAAGVGLSTVVDFEKGRREVSIETVATIRKALEAAGVVFVDPNGGGPGVRIANRD